jgi:hypothetical protein
MLLGTLYFFHVIGKKIRITVYISNLPNNIEKMRIHLQGYAISLYVFEAPASARAGPILFIIDATVLNAVTGSVPKIVKIIENTPNNPKYKTTNPNVFVRISSLTGLPLSFTCIMALGLSRCTSSLALDLKRSIILATFIPPAVDPAHPPINITRTRKNLQQFGHLSKSALQNPVLVVMETT